MSHIKNSLPSMHLNKKFSSEEVCKLVSKTDVDLLTELSISNSGVDDKFKCRNKTNMIRACDDSINGVKTRSQNKTFANNKIRELEHTNSLLMKKILSYNQKCNDFKEPPKIHLLTSSALNRKKQQKQIDHDNLVLNCGINV